LEAFPINREKKLPKALNHYFIFLFFLFAFCLVALASDSFLLHRTAEFFGGTAMNRPFTLKTLPEYFIFGALALFYSLVFFGTILILLYRFVYPWLGLNGAQSLYSSALVLSATYISYTTIKHQIHRYFQNMFDMEILKELTAGNLLNLFGYISPQHLLGAVGALLFAALNIFLIRWLKKVDWLLSPFVPNRKHLVSLFAAWLGLIVIHFNTASFESLRFGLKSTLSYIVSDKVLSRLSDFDQDGFGPLTSPPDSDNFDSAINPWALDIPDNGKDENGLLGDFSASKSKPETGFEVSRVTWPANPKNIILAVVETFRSDVVEMKIGGSPVMPFLSELAKRETFTPDVYSNYGVTARAIQSTFFGKLGYNENDTTLFDIFREQGYALHAVSAMDEDWGQNYQLLGMDNLDSFYDTRFVDWNKRNLTTWESLNPSLLSLGWDEINKKAFEVLRSSEKPFFLYLNYQDLHYPYYHRSMDLKFIEKGHKDSRFFKPKNRDHILKQYANAAFHLDKGLEQLFSFLEEEELVEDTLIIIIGDHPDSIYENGLLGHAWTVDIHQRQTPLLLVGARGLIETPIGHHQLGQIILDSLSSNSGSTPAKVQHERNGKQFVLTGSLEQPRQIAWLSPAELISYDFKTRRAQYGENSPWLKLSQALEHPKAGLLASLVHKWESLRVERLSQSK